VLGLCAKAHEAKRIALLNSLPSFITDRFDSQTFNYCIEDSVSATGLRE
jgi:hypothetical protein